MGEGGEREAFGGKSSLTEFETISSKICGWAGELGKDHDLRQRPASNSLVLRHCTS